MKKSRARPCGRGRRGGGEAVASGPAVALSVCMDILERIKSYKLEEIAAAKAARPLSAVEAEARAARPLRGFARALADKAATGPALSPRSRRPAPPRG